MLVKDIVLIYLLFIEDTETKLDEFLLMNDSLKFTIHLRVLFLNTIKLLISMLDEVQLYATVTYPSKHCIK